MLGRVDAYADRSAYLPATMSSATQRSCPLRVTQESCGRAGKRWLAHVGIAAEERDRPIGLDLAHGDGCGRVGRGLRLPGEDGADWTRADLVGNRQGRKHLVAGATVVHAAVEWSAIERKNEDGAVALV